MMRGWGREDQREWGREDEKENVREWGGRIREGA